jgi:hypothetical protein
MFDRSHLKIKKTVVIEPDLFYSEAFKSLSASAMRTLMRCLQKRNWVCKKDPGTNFKRVVYLDEPFIFPYEEARFLGIGTTQYWKNMTKLVEVGFVDIVHQGGWYQKYKKEKDYSVYKLSDRWKLYGTDNFKRIDKAQVLSPEYFIRKNLEKKDSRATSRKRSELLHESEVDKGKKADARLHKSEVDDVRQEHVQSLVNVN